MEPRRPQTITVYCIAHLHPFDVPVLAMDVACPVCGCAFVRLQQSDDTASLAKTDLANVYLASSPPTWLDRLAKDAEEE
jgi:hypothetical protein